MQYYQSDKNFQEFTKGFDILILMDNSYRTSFWGVMNRCVEIAGMTSSYKIPPILLANDDFSRYLLMHYLSTYRNIHLSQRDFQHVFQHISPRLNGNKSFILELISKEPLILQYIDSKFKADKQVVLMAVSKNYESIKYIDHTLRLDRDIALCAIQQSGQAYFHIDQSLKSDPEIILKVIKRCKEYINYIDLDFTGLNEDQNFMLEMIKLYWPCISCIGPKLRLNQEFMLQTTQYIPLNNKIQYYAHININKHYLTI